MSTPETVVALATFDRELLAGIEAELTAIRKNNRPQGRPFNLADAFNLAGVAGNAQMKDVPPAGQLWYLEAVAVSVAGASAAATVALYLDSAADERNAIGGCGSLQGNSPSRGSVTFPQPLPWFTGIPLIVAIAGAAGAGAVAVRYWGRAEEVGIATERRHILEGQGAV